MSEQCLNELITQLDDEEFEKREAASQRLEDLPANYAAILLAKTKEHKDSPEVIERLLRITKKIWDEKIFMKDERYLRIFGLIGFECCPIYAETVTNPDVDPYQYTLEIDGMRVTTIYPLDCADGIIKEQDVVVMIDNIQAAQFLTYQRVAAGKKYDILVHRYKDASKLKENKPDLNSEYQELSLQVTASFKTWLNEYELKSLEEARSQAWLEFYKTVLEE